LIEDDNLGSIGGEIPGRASRSPDPQDSEQRRDNNEQLQEFAPRPCGGVEDKTVRDELAEAPNKSQATQRAPGSRRFGQIAKAKAGGQQNGQARLFPGAQGCGLSLWVHPDSGSRIDRAPVRPGSAQRRRSARLPSCPGRTGGSARCRRENRDGCRNQWVSCRWGSAISRPSTPRVACPRAPVCVEAVMPARNPGSEDPGYNAAATNALPRATAYQVKPGRAVARR